MEISEKIISARIKSFLSDHGIKQTFLVDKLGCTASTISDILNGRRGISVVMYAQICLALGVPYEYFIDGLKV